MKQFVVSALRKCTYDLPKGSMYVMQAASYESVVSNFWKLESDSVFEDEDFSGSVMVYDIMLGKVVYRYGCNKE